MRKHRASHPIQRLRVLLAGISLFLKIPDALTIHKKHSQQYMFMPFFSQAQAIVDGEPYNSEQGKTDIRQLLTPFIEMN
jgi:hypothetical protein